MQAETLYSKFIYVEQNLSQLGLNTSFTNTSFTARKHFAVNFIVITSSCFSQNMQITALWVNSRWQNLRGVSEGSSTVILFWSDYTPRKYKYYIWLSQPWGWAWNWKIWQKKMKHMADIFKPRRIMSDPGFRRVSYFPWQMLHFFGQLIYTTKKAKT